MDFYISFMERFWVRGCVVCSVSGSSMRGGASLTRANTPSRLRAAAGAMRSRRAELAFVLVGLALPRCPAQLQSGTNCRTVVGANTAVRPSSLTQSGITLCVWKAPPLVLPSSGAVRSQSIADDVAGLPAGGTLVQNADMSLTGFDVDFACVPLSCIKMNE